MSGTFDGNALFSSGPARWAIRPRGIESQPRWRITGNNTHSGTLPIGQVELEVVVTGRLVAATEAALWTLREAVADAAVFADGAATLVDGRGRSFPDMWFIEYTEADRVDKGRVWSIGYTAAFRNYGAI
jgi:hypothetical protein